MVIKMTNINEVKRWLRSRSGTIERREHLIEILKEKFDNAEEILNTLISQGIVKEEKGWIDLIGLFRGIKVEDDEEE
jgi:hypothetical protein